MNAKLNISDKFLSEENKAGFNSLIPENISQLVVDDIEVREKYGDSVEITLAITITRLKVVGRRFLSVLTSKKEVYESLKGNRFEDLSEENKITCIEMVLKNNQQYLKETIFNN